MSQILLASNYKGYYTTQSALEAAIPVGAKNWWAIIGDENAVYIWNIVSQEWATSSGSGGTSTIFVEVPVGAKDGMNREFTLSRTPQANSLMLYKSGQALTQGIDYAILNRTITLSIDAPAPTEDTNLLAQYNPEAS